MIADPNGRSKIISLFNVEDKENVGYGKSSIDKQCFGVSSDQEETGLKSNLIIYYTAALHFDRAPSNVQHVRNNALTKVVQSAQTLGSSQLSENVQCGHPNLNEKNLLDPLSLQGVETTPQTHDQVIYSDGWTVLYRRQTDKCFQRTDESDV